MTAIQILFAVVVVCWLIGSRLRGQLAAARRLLVLPLVLIAIGVDSLSKAVGHHPPSTELTLIAASAIAAFGLGALRGSTVQLGVRDGQLWYRYRPVTVLLWLVSFGFDAAIHLAGSALGYTAISHGVLMIVGLAFAGESAVVYLRTQLAGLPFPKLSTEQQSRATRARAGSPDLVKR